MGDKDSMSTSAPLHVVLTMLQFAVPEMIPTSEARLLSKGTVSALAGAPFWRGFTADLSRDPSAPESGFSVDSDAPAPGTRLRNIAEGKSSGGTLRAAAHRGGGSNNRSGAALGGVPERGLADEEQSQTPLEARGAAGEDRGMKCFLRRYRYHVAFGGPVPPRMETETVEMPFSLSPSCLDICGRMIALGTQEGVVLLFDTKLPQDDSSAAHRRPAAASPGQKRGKTAGREPSTVRRDNPGKWTQSSRFPGTYAGCRSCTVYRVYGSTSGGEGRISTVALDRAKVIAASRSHRAASGFVIRVYTVDSPRLIRTILCGEEVAQMKLMDPCLAFLTTRTRRLCVRDLYASGLGDTGRLDSYAAEDICAFDAAEGVGDGGVSDMIFHCSTTNGRMLEVTSSSAGRHEAPGRWASRASNCEQLTRCSVCVDMEALLLVQTTMAGVVSGWRLLRNGRRAMGCIFSVDMTIPQCHKGLASAHLARGGLFLAVAPVGDAPQVWDVRLMLKKTFVGGSSCPGPGSPPAAAAGAGMSWEAREGPIETVVSNRSGTTERSGGASARRVWRLAPARSEEWQHLADDDRRRPESSAFNRGIITGDSRSISAPNRRGRPRYIPARLWPANVWGLEVKVDAGKGRLVSACSDGRLRITRILPNTEERRLRAAVERGRRAKLAGVAGANNSQK